MVTLMFLQMSLRPKTARAAMICACVATRIYESRSVALLLHVRVGGAATVIAVVVHGALICWSTIVLTRRVDIREKRRPEAKRRGGL